MLRLERTIVHARLHHPGDEERRGKLERKLRSLAFVCDDFGTADASNILDLGDLVKKCADECRHKDNVERLEKWRISLDENKAKARRWVKRSHVAPEDRKEQPSEQAVNPVERLQREANSVEWE